MLLIASVALIMSMSSVKCTIVTQSSTSEWDFSDDFTSSWFTYVNEQGDVYLQMTLEIKNVDYSDWTT
jgi:hypothetical protein